MAGIEILESQQVYEGSSFRVMRNTLRIPSGETVTRDMIAHPGAVVIVPKLSATEYLLVRQFRHAVGCELLEFPAGTLKPSEGPEACAQREISEETGYAARRWTSLGTQYPAPGFCNELQYFFLAEDLYPRSAALDEDECIEVVSMNISQIECAVLEGQILDGKTLAILTKARLMNLL